MNSCIPKKIKYWGGQTEEKNDKKKAKTKCKVEKKNKHGKRGEKTEENTTQKSVGVLYSGFFSSIPGFGDLYLGRVD